MRVPSRPGIALLLAAWAAGGTPFAFAEAGDVSGTDVPSARPGTSLVDRIGVSDATVRDSAPGAGTHDAPRLIRNDSSDPQRSAPGLRGGTSELGYRWWTSKGRGDIGLGFGTLAYVSRPTGSIPGLASGDGATTVVASGTVLTLGMRYKTSEHSSFFADAAGWRANGLQGNDGVAGKVGLEFKSAQSRLNISYGGLGMRLAGDTRMTLRVRRGGLGIYMRSSF